MSYKTQSESASPPTPASGKGTWYIDTSGRPRFVDDNGIDMILSEDRAYNWIRNSGFWFAQRQAPGTLTTYSNTTGRAIAGADGWGVTNENASIQFQRTDTATAPETGLAGRFYGSFTKITALGKLVVSQVIEGTDTGALRGSTVRVQAWLKAVGGNATWRLGLAYLNTGTPDSGLPATFVSAFGANGTDPTLGTNMSYLTPKTGVLGDGGTINGNAVPCAAVTTGWTRFGAVFDVPSNARNLVLLIWSDSQVAINSGIAVSQASVTVGQSIQDWQPAAYQTEFERVMRFYAKSFNVDTAPAQNAGIAGSVRGVVNTAAATAGQVLGCRFPVPMRIAPTTITFYNPSAANAFVRNTKAATDATATASANVGEQGMDITYTGILAWAVGDAVGVHYSADAEI